MPEPIARVLEYERRATLDLARTIPDRACDARPAGLAQSPCWIVCHLGLADARQHGTLTIGKPGGEDGYLQQFGPGSNIARGREHMLARYGSWFDAIDAVAAGHARLLDAVRAADPARLAGPHPNERLRDIFPTLADNIAYAVWHEGHHGGQLRAWAHAARHAGILPARPAPGV